MTPTEQLEATTVVADAFDRAERSLLHALIDLWPASAWKAAGATSPTAWLVAVSQRPWGDARRLVRIAERCAQHSALADAVTSGAVSLRRAHLICRAVTDERAGLFGASVDALVQAGVELARDEDLDAAVAYWAERADEHLRPSAPPPHRVWLSENLFGGGHLDADLTPAAFANVVSAIDAFTQDPDSADAPHRRSLGERRADALDDLAHAALAGGSDPEERADDVFDGIDHRDHGRPPSGDPLADFRQRLQSAVRRDERRECRRTVPRSRTTVEVTVDLSTLTGQRGEHDLAGITCRNQRWTLTRDAVEHLSCNASLAASLFARPGRPVDAGHATPVFSDRQRRLITERDRHCAFPSCTRPPRHCDIHHLVPLGSGGPTTVDNGVLLCRHHHRLVHRGWILDRGSLGWTATDPEGTTWHQGRLATRPDPPVPIATG